MYNAITLKSDTLPDLIINTRAGTLKTSCHDEFKMLILLLPVTLRVVITTTFGATSDDKVGIFITLSF